MNMRRILKQPTLRMQAGGAYGDDKTAAFVAANPPKPAAPTAWGGENRGSLQRGGEAPGPAPAMAPATPPILRDGNSFGGAASLRPGSAPAAPMSNQQQYTADAVSARGAGMQATSGDWARTTAYSPPGVSPMPAAAGTPGLPIAAAAPAASGAAAAGALDRQSALRERIAAAPSNFTPMAMPTIGMKHGGSYKDGIGGVVPGKPRGDIYAANYEGGETVVSNHVQEDNPGLKEQLASLREESLARRGMTPEQADAKAVSGPTLRAMDGVSWPGMAKFNDALDAAGIKRIAETPSGPRAAPSSQMEMFPKGVPSNAPLGAQTEIPMAAQPKPTIAPGYTPPKVNSEGIYESRAKTWESRPGVQVGAGAGQAGQAGPAIQVGSQAAVPQTGTAGAGSGGRTGVLGSVREGVNNLRTGLSAQPGPVSKSAFLAGKVLSNPLVGFAGRAAAGAGVVQNFNDYKLNDPGVDSSASGTWNALRRGDMSAAGASLSKGAKEAAMDVGSNIANTADLVVPGTGPSQAYNKALRDHFGGRLIDNSGNASSTGVDVGVEPPQQLASYAGRGEAWDSRRLDANGGRGDLPAAADPRRLDMDPSRSSLGASRDFTNELSGRPGGKMAALPSDLRQGVVHKTVDAQGRVTYSGRNVGVNGDGETQMVDGTGRNLKMLNGNNNNFARSIGADGKPDGPMVVPGMTSLRGGAGGDGGVSAALSAAAARGDMDAVRGYYASRGESFAGGSTQPRKPEYINAYKARTEREKNAIAIRGQDQQMEIAMAPSKLAAQQRKMAADIFKQAGGDNARAAGLAMSLGMDPKAYHDALAAQNTARASDQAVAEKFRENGKKEFQVFADGKLDEQASGQMFDTARRLFPKIEDADEKTRNAAMADAKELTGIFQKARSQDKVGFDALKFWQPQRAELSGMPDARGGKAETLSGFGGMVTVGASNGDTILTKDGKKVNLGRLNQRQLELLNTAQKSNWGN